MVALSVQVEGWFGLNWPKWKRLVTEIEALGFVNLFRSDHFNVPSLGNVDSLELILSLTYLADHSQRVQFGPLVAPLSFRDPVMLSRQAAQLDDLSGGRMILGLGAGWMVPEHEIFGYNLGDVRTRLDRFEEGLEVASRLLQGPEPASFEGRYYRLHEATLRPRSPRPGGTPILVGGGGMKRTLPLAARFANIWNGNSLSPEAFAERSIRLDELLQQEGRRPEDVQRSMQILVLCGRTRAELERRLQPVRKMRPELAGASLDEVIAGARSQMEAIVGTPEEVIERIHAYERVGLQELMVQLFDMDDVEGLQILAEHVLPAVA
jgi:alkanesulfonate monooxygenase SsuD/methylene tetrahydromethanopterin reductase-like flavin-dependent oxidoreductase (luciferase family)